MFKTFVDNDTSGLVPQRQKASDYDNSGPAPQLQNVFPSADTTVLSQQELDLLFGPLYDEFFTAEPTTPTNVNAEENNDNQTEDALFQQDKIINPFCTPIREIAESSSRNIDNSNMHTFYQPHDFEYRWTKDHPLSKVRGNPSKPEAMADSTWIEAMHEELHQFDRLKVWELVDNPFGKKVLNLKWLWKNKKDEDQTVIPNKAQLVAKGYA
ncbi:hypothetical protein Tco_1429604 [Tanacetum coccineum]